MFTKQHVVFVGAGAIGTSMGNILASKENLHVTLLSIEADVVEDINKNHLNQKYFPGVPLQKALKATTDNTVLSKAEVVVFWQSLLLLPSVLYLR